MHTLPPFSSKTVPVIVITHVDQAVPHGTRLVGWGH